MGVRAEKGQKKNVKIESVLQHEQGQESSCTEANQGAAGRPNCGLVGKGNQPAGPSALEGKAPGLQWKWETRGRLVHVEEGGGVPAGSPQADWSPACSSKVLPVPTRSLAQAFSLSGVQLHLPSSTAQAAGFQGLPRPPRSAHSPTGMDLRSAAILTKKESIEQVSPGTGEGERDRPWAGEPLGASEPTGFSLGKSPAEGHKDGEGPGASLMKKG